MSSPGWVVKVEDNGARPDQDLIVQVLGKRVVLTAPKPGIARMAGPELQVLIDVLRAARDELFLRDSQEPHPPERPGR